MSSVKEPAFPWGKRGWELRVILHHPRGLGAGSSVLRKEKLGGEEALSELGRTELVYFSRERDRHTIYQDGTGKRKKCHPVQVSEQFDVVST